MVGFWWRMHNLLIALTLALTVPRPLIYLIALRHTITFSVCCITASELVCQPNKLSWVGGGWCKNVGLFDQEEVYFSLFSLFRSFIIVNLWMLESGSFQYFQCGAWVLSWKSIFLAPGAASVSAFIVEMPLRSGMVFPLQKRECWVPYKPQKGMKIVEKEGSYTRNIVGKSPLCRNWGWAHQVGQGP